jgi:ribosomal-protein-alanine N-acetyltransferase
VRTERLRWWDLDEVLAIERHAFAADRPWTPEQLWSELAGVPDTRHYVVARRVDRDPVCGYAGMSVGPDTGDLLTLAVAPTQRRGGVGRLLLDAVLAEASRRRLVEVLLEVRVDNEPALGLYRSAGFELLTRRRGYYADGTDGCVMRRRVGAGHG